MKKSKRMRFEANLAELRKLHKEFRLEVLEFSKIHYRVVGEQSVDYWLTTGRAWLVGSFDGAKPMTVAEVCGLAWGLKQDVDI